MADDSDKAMKERLEELLAKPLSEGFVIDRGHEMPEFGPPRAAPKAGPAPQ